MFESGSGGGKKELSAGSHRVGLLLAVDGKRNPGTGAVAYSPLRRRLADITGNRTASNL